MAGNTPERNRWLLPLFFLATGLLLCLYLRNAPIGDFGNYYFGSKLWLQGTPSAVLYDACSFNERIRSEPGMEEATFFLNYTPVPPASLILYAPFTWMPWQEAKLIFNLLGLLAFCIALYRILALLPLRPAVLLFLPLIFLLPMKSNIQEGQAYMFIAAFLMESFRSATNSFRAALFLALASALKLFPLVVILYFVARRQYKTVFLSLLFFLLFAIGGAWAVGAEAGARYWADIVPRLFQNEINDPYAINYQSVFVWLKSMLVGDALLNPQPLLHAPLLFELISGMLSGLFFFLAFRAIKRGEDSFLYYGVAVILGFVASAYASTYSLFLLILPAAALPAHRRKWMAMILLIFICTIPVYALEKLPPVFHFLKAAILLLFFFTWLPSVADRWRAIPLVLTIVSFMGIRWWMYEPSPDSSTYLTNRNPGMLLCNYQQRNGYLVLQGFNEHGRVRDSLPITKDIDQDSRLSVDRGQVVDSGTAITGGRDNKLHPGFYGDSLVIYLSDRNRGVGFYALRKIPWRRDTGKNHGEQHAK